MVSIIMPYYNGKEFVKETIDSILSQTFLDYELIIVNDGSPLEDERLYIEQLVQAYNDSRIKYLIKSNGGLSDSRNFGIKASQGEFIAFIDQDDLWEATKLEKQMKIFSDSKEVKFICTDGVYIGSQTGPMNRGKTRRIFKSSLIENTFCMLMRGSFIICSSVIFSRELQKKVGWSNTNYRFVPDYEYFLRFSEAANFYFMTEELTKYRIHGSNTSRNQFQAQVETLTVLCSKKLSGIQVKIAATNQFLRTIVRLVISWSKQLVTT